MMKVSIIIPIYNTEKYLHKCLDSVISQSYRNIEIIAVNDGSKGNALDILNNYMHKDDRIVVLDKLNEGVHQARISGFKRSSGDFICFIDSDDWVSNDYVEILVDNIKRYNADVVSCAAYRVLDKYSLFKIKQHADSMIFHTNEEVMQHYIGFMGVNIFSVSIWGKLIKRELIEVSDISSLSLRHGEDLYMLMKVFPKCDKIVFLSEYLYFYRWGGMTSKYSPSIMLDAIKLYSEKINCAEKYEVKDGLKYVRIELLKFVQTTMLSLLIHTNLSKEEVIASIKELMKYEEIQESLENIDTKDPFKIAMQRSDFNEMYNIAARGKRKSRFKRCFIYALSKLGLI